MITTMIRLLAWYIGVNKTQGKQNCYLYAQQIKQYKLSNTALILYESQ